MNTQKDIQEMLAYSDRLKTLTDAEFGDLNQQIADKQLELDLQFCDMLDRMPADLDESEAELLIGLATKAGEKILGEFSNELIAARSQH